MPPEVPLNLGNKIRHWLPLLRDKATQPLPPSLVPHDVPPSPDRKGHIFPAGVGVDSAPQEHPRKGRAGRTVASELDVVSPFRGLVPGAGLVVEQATPDALCYLGQGPRDGIIELLLGGEAASYLGDERIVVAGVVNFQILYC